MSAKLHMKWRAELSDPDIIKNLRSEAMYQAAEEIQTLANRCAKFRAELARGGE